MRSRVSASFRALSVSVACFLVLSQISSFLHFFVVQHTVCPEHGELVHAAPGDLVAATSPDPLPQSRDNAVDTAKSSRSSDANHGHDHCMVCAQRREHATLARSPAVVPPSLGAKLAVARDRGARILSSVPLYLIAPKNSPPA